VAVHEQEWERFHGEDIAIVFTGEDNTNPTAFAMTLTVKRAKSDVSAILAITQASMTVAGSGPYTISVPLTRAQTGTTLSPTTYPSGVFHVDLWRTDSGSNQCLASGKLKLKVPARSPS
jgi:hypothetical protein